MKVSQRKWLAWQTAPYRRHGACHACRRTHDEQGRPLYLRGRTKARVYCLTCFPT